MEKSEDNMTPKNKSLFLSVLAMYRLSLALCENTIKARADRAALSSPPITDEVCRLNPRLLRHVLQLPKHKIGGEP